MRIMLSVQPFRILFFAALAFSAGLVIYITQSSNSSTDRVMNDEVAQIETSLTQVRRLVGANAVMPADKELGRLEEQWRRVQGELLLRARRSGNTEIMVRGDSFERSIAEARVAVLKGDGERAQQTITRLQTGFNIIKEDLTPLVVDWPWFLRSLFLLTVFWLGLVLVFSQIARQWDSRILKRARSLKAKDAGANSMK